MWKDTGIRNLDPSLNCKESEKQHGDQWRPTRSVSRFSESPITQDLRVPVVLRTGGVFFL